MSRIHPLVILSGLLFILCSNQIGYSQATNKNSSSGFPQYVNTGNQLYDDSVYQEAKAKWIKEHPDQYPENTSLAAVEANKEKISNIDFTPVKKFTLQKMEAINAPGKNLSKEQLLLETQNIKKDFPENDTYFETGTNSQVRMLIHGKVVFVATEIIHTDKIEWKIIDASCASCDKSLFILSKKETDESLVYVMMSEDEGSDFSYQFTFIPN